MAKTSPQLSMHEILFDYAIEIVHTLETQR